MLSILLLQILKFEMFDLENLGQGYRVQSSRCSHAMAMFININVYKVIIEHFSLALRYPDFKLCDLENVGQGHNITLAMVPFNGKYVTSHLMAIVGQGE